MAVKISVWGTGLAAILGAGSIILAGLNNANWGTFLAASILVFLLSLVLRKLRF